MNQQRLLVSSLISIAAFGMPTVCAESTFKVTYLNFEGSTDAEKPSQFVDSIDASSGFSASFLGDANPRDWKSPPAGVSTDEWIQLVKVKIGAQCDFIAFTFSDKNGTVSYAGHRPSKQRAVLYWFSVPPGRAQLPQNAIRECATDIVYDRASVIQRQRAPVQLEIRKWESSEDGDSPADSLLAGNASGELNTAPIEALTFGAAYNAGWQPSNASRPTKITIEIREEFAVFFTLRATINNDNKKRVIVRKKVPHEELYPNLVRLFTMLQPTSTITSFAFLGSDQSRLIGWKHGLALISNGPDTHVVKPQAGKKLWEFEGKGKTPPAHDVDSGTILRRAASLSGVDWETGETTPLGKTPSDSPYALAEDGRIATIDAGSLRVFNEGTLEQAFNTSNLSGAVVWCGKLLVASQGSTVFGFSRDKKSALWNADIGRDVTRLFSVNDLVLAEDGQSLHALSPQSGKVLWKCTIGDFVVGRPELTGAGLIVASKNNHIRLIDSSTGEVKKSARWPTWLRAVQCVAGDSGTEVFILDLRNEISELDAATLTVRKRHSIGQRLLPNLWFAKRMPLTWLPISEQTADDFDNLVGELQFADCVLCQDTEGFVYMLPVKK